MTNVFCKKDRVLEDASLEQQIDPNIALENLFLREFQKED